MKNTEMNKKQFTTYIIAAFGLAYTIQIIASIFGDYRSPVFSGLLSLTMFMPFISVLISGYPLRGMGFIPHLKGRIRYLFFALWMPALLSTLGSVLFFVIFPDTFDSEFRNLRGMMENAGALEQMEAQGITIPMYLLLSVIAAVTFGPVLNMFVALGEEVGWRGAMYPYLKKQFGDTKGRIIGGIIWGIWHWPCIILAGYNYGKEYIGAPVLGPVVFCISTIVMGILLDFVYEKTECIWLPSLMHGAINAFTLSPYLVNPDYAQPLQPLYCRLSVLGPVPLGLIAMIPMGITAVLICLKKKA